MAWNLVMLSWFGCGMKHVSDRQDKAIREKLIGKSKKVSQTICKVWSADY